MPILPYGFNIFMNIYGHQSTKMDDSFIQVDKCRWLSMSARGRFRPSMNAYKRQIIVGVLKFNFCGR